MAPTDSLPRSKARGAALVAGDAAAGEINGGVELGAAVAMVACG